MYKLLIINTLLIFTINQVKCQNNENRKCFADNKVKSVLTYHIVSSKDTIQDKWRVTDLDKYDKYGNQILWRQFDSSDSTKYSDRIFQYNSKGNLIKMMNSPKDSIGGLIDSAGIDKNGFVNYRKMYRPSGEILFEMAMKTEINKNRKPTKILIFDKRGEQQGYMLFIYNVKNKIIEERAYDTKNTIVEKTLYSYHSNDTLKETKKIIGSNNINKIHIYNELGLLLEEIHYREELKGEINYKVIRTYDKSNREIENITYTMLVNKLRPSRKETSIYNINCLKIKTKIYSIDQITDKEEIYTISKYKYEYYKI